MGIDRTVDFEKIVMRVLDQQTEKEHFHQGIQLIYLLDGTMQLQVSNQEFSLKKDDIVVINANKKHSFEASEDVLYCEITIAYQIIMNAFGNMRVIFWCNSTIDKNESYEKLREIIKNLLNRYMLKTEGTTDFGRMGLFYYLLEVLSVNFVVRSEDKVHETDQDKFNERIEQINNYIRTNYNQAISLKDLSEQLYLSNAYLSRFFKKQYGMNFAEYLTNIRLYHAVDELLYTDYPITRIAMDNGFSNVPAFNKVFRSIYKEPPSSFRKKSRKVAAKKNKVQEAKEKLEKYLSEAEIEKIEEHTGSSIKAEICVKEYRSYTKTWNQMINIGPAEDLLDSETQEHILLLKEKLQFQYVRFWNLFSPKLLIHIGDESKEYNFSKIDAILDFLMQCKVKPFIEFGQKPKRVQKNVRSVLVYEEEAPIFTHLYQWKSVLEELMKHVIRRYGRDEVGTWKFEIWKDDRLGRQSVGDKVHYFEVFNAGYEIMKELVPEAEIGGCGCRATFCMDEFISLIQTWKEQPFKPDFFSIMSYSYIAGEEAQESFSKRSTDSDFLCNVIEKTKEELERQEFIIKNLYVTEWNLTISERNNMNDTCFKGAYIMKNVIDSIEKAQILGYFVGSDRFSEYYDSTEILHGGTGLITKDGIMKPAGFAYAFLNCMYQYLVTKGANYMITTNGYGNYGIVCHNYKRLNYYYFRTEEDQIDKKRTWQYFEDRDSIDLDLNLMDIADGEYQIKIQRMNEESGSILHNWGEMNYYKELTREDVKYLRRISEPKRTVENIRVTNNKANLHIRLAANEIALIKIIKYI